TFSASIYSFTSLYELFSHLLCIAITEHTPTRSCGLTSYISGSNPREWGDTLPPRANRTALPRWRIVRIRQTPLSTGLSRRCGYTYLHFSLLVSASSPSPLAGPSQ